MVYFVHGAIGVIGDGVIVRQSEFRIRDIFYQFDGGIYAVPPIKYHEPTEIPWHHEAKVERLGQVIALPFDNHEPDCPTEETAPLEPLLQFLDQLRLAQFQIDLLQQIRADLCRESDPVLQHVRRNDIDDLPDDPVLAVQGIQQAVVAREPVERVCRPFHEVRRPRPQPRQHIAEGIPGARFDGLRINRCDSFSPMLTH